MAAAQREQEEEQVLEKWEGKATARLKGVRAEQVWPLFLDDFCNYHKWLPTIDTCRQVEGIHGKPGLVRYCASTQENSTGGADVDGERKHALWCHEKLVAIDPVVRCLSYEVLENNMGIKSLVSTIKVLPSTTATIKSGGEVDDEHDGDDQFGCQIQWSFLADPFEGLMTYDGFSAYISFALQGMAEKMEKALQSN